MKRRSAGVMQRATRWVQRSLSSRARRTVLSAHWIIICAGNDIVYKTDFEFSFSRSLDYSYSITIRSHFNFGNFSAMPPSLFSGALVITSRTEVRPYRPPPKPKGRRRTKAASLLSTPKTGRSDGRCRALSPSKAAADRTWKNVRVKVTLGTESTLLVSTAVVPSTALAEGERSGTTKTQTTQTHPHMEVEAETFSEADYSEAKTLNDPTATGGGDEAAAVSRTSAARLSTMPLQPCAGGSIRVESRAVAIVPSATCVLESAVSRSVTTAAHPHGLTQDLAPMKRNKRGGGGRLPVRDMHVGADGTSLLLCGMVCI